jgi:hypothetical protein
MEKVESKTKCNMCEKEINLSKLSLASQKVMLLEYNTLIGGRESHMFCYPKCFDPFPYPGCPLTGAGCIVCSTMCGSEDWFVTIEDVELKGFITYKASCSEACSMKISEHESKNSKLCNVCNNCGKLLKDNPKKCAKCRRAFYCDKECQKADWNAHKKECS